MRRHVPWAIENEKVYNSIWCVCQQADADYDEKRAEWLLYSKQIALVQRHGGEKFKKVYIC